MRTKAMKKRDLLFAALAACAAPFGAQPAPANPFAGASFYVSPEWTAQVESAAAASADPQKAALVRSLAQQPVALWVDSIDAAKNAVPRWLDGARGKLAVLVLYDLPNRDCAAQASAGELGPQDGARYRAEVVDPLAAQLRAHADQRIAIVIEPDSLPNLVTNGNVKKCADSDALYRESIAYAVSSLSMPHVSLYLDAGHAGWLGWDPHRAKIAAIFQDVLQRAGGPQKIRGFATNVSGYGVLRGDDGRRLEPSNPCPDELTYVEKLSGDLAKVGISGKGFVIDTSRNGRAGIRSKSAHWCNLKGAGLGERPRASPAPNVDAYFWIKVPGESDGTSDPNAPRFDATCASEDSAPDAPEAGTFFPAYFLGLVERANPPLR
jgi:cellulose 1,4-beta-cellobiosidase